MTDEMAGGESRPIQTGKLGWGAVLIVLGGALLLEQLDVFYFDDLIRYWPLVLVVVGGATLATARRRSQRHSGLWLACLGGWLLVNTLGLWGFWWDNSWPLLLIIIGALMVARSLPRARRERAAEAGSAPPPDELSLAAGEPATGLPAEEASHGR